MEKEQQHKERFLKDYLHLIEIPVIGLGHDATWIMKAARYLYVIFFVPRIDSIDKKKKNSN